MVKKKIDNEKEFWDKKIINWEDGRYFNKNKFFFEKISDFFSYSLHFRRQKSYEFLKKIGCKNKIICELGCGSGFLAKKIIKLGAKNYLGIDISSEAINRAKIINKKLINKNKCFFYCGRINNFRFYKKVDIFFSLGFIDWISDKELKYMKDIIGFDKIFFHSFSLLKKINIIQFLHKAYVYFSYKRKKKLSPIYRSKNNIIKIYKNHSKLFFYSHKKLSFGCFFGNINFE